MTESSIFDFRVGIQYLNSCRVELGDKEEMIHSIWLHHVLFQPYAELEQMRKGFHDTLQVELLCLTHGEEVRELLAHSTMFEVSVDHLQLLLNTHTMGRIIVQKRMPL